MKSILLTTTALVAFAGAAVADGHTGVSFGGDAELGYNNDVKDGYYWNFGATLNAAQELDNGITAAIKADIVFDSDDTRTGGNVTADDFVLSLTAANAALRFGDIDAVAEDNFGGVDGETTVGFTESSNDVDAVLVGEVTFGDVKAMVSYMVDFEGEATNPQFYATGSFGAINAELGYEAAADGNDAITGVSASTALAGVDVTVAYITDGTETSTGVGVSYPFGPVTLGGYYSLNDVAEDSQDNSWGAQAVYAAGPASMTANYEERRGVWRYNVEGAYDISKGLVARAGYIDREPWTGEAFYVASEYDLGSGAALLVSYAEAKDQNYAADDEIGDPEYMHGTTVEVSFKF